MPTAAEEAAFHTTIEHCVGVVRSMMVLFHDRQRSLEWGADVQDHCISCFEYAAGQVGPYHQPYFDTLVLLVFRYSGDAWSCLCRVAHLLHTSLIVCRLFRANSISALEAAAEQELANMRTLKNTVGINAAVLYFHAVVCLAKAAGYAHLVEPLTIDTFFDHEKYATLRCGDVSISVLAKLLFIQGDLVTISKEMVSTIGNKL